MDLDTAAVLLSLDIDPDPFRLREQQFRLVDRKIARRICAGRFPSAPFPNLALEVARKRRPEIDTTAFGEYVAIMEQRKQVRRISLKTAVGLWPSTDFRHEKISDFYLHFALLEADLTKRFELAGNDRFAGLYDYLARELPLDAANELKEYLLSSALDSNDHRLSDRFLSTCAGARCLVATTRPGSGNTTLRRASLLSKNSIASPRCATGPRRRCAPRARSSRHLAREAADSPPRKRKASNPRSETSS